MHRRQLLLRATVLTCLCSMTTTANAQPLPSEYEVTKVADGVYAFMLAYARRFPDELFTGSPETMQALREAIQRAQGQ